MRIEERARAFGLRPRRPRGEGAGQSGRQWAAGLRALLRCVQLSVRRDRKSRRGSRTGGRRVKSDPPVVPGTMVRFQTDFSIKID